MRSTSTLPRQSVNGHFLFVVLCKIKGKNVTCKKQVSINLSPCVQYIECTYETDVFCMSDVL